MLRRSPAARVAMLTTALAMLAACGAMNTYKTPTILPKGQAQVLAALQIHGAQATPEVAAPMPELALGYRRGMAPNVELAVSATILPLGDYLTAGSLEVAAKTSLWRHGRYQLAISGAVGYRIAVTSGAAFETVYAGVPLIGGLKLGKHMLVLSPLLSYQRIYASGARPVTVPAAGASLGAVLRLSQRWDLMPELMWSGSPTSNFMDGNSELFHAGIAFAYRQ